jgi:glucan 1,3-beta-glucosidase
MKDNKLRGVNLGGWLVLEKWITPSLFKTRQASDEYGLCLELGQRKEDVLRVHHESFITADDFRWIASHGLNSVRIPVGYGIFGDIEPYVDTIERLDWAMEQAAANNLQVLIDLHMLPGLANDWNRQHTQGKNKWVDAQNVVLSVNTLKRLAERYSMHESLWGIGVLNESLWDVPKKALGEYYSAAYSEIREHCDERIAVLYHDNWRPAEYSRLFTGVHSRALMMDMHLYQVFAEEDKNLSVEEHIEKATGWRHLIRRVQHDIPIIIGEWSGRLNEESLRGLSEIERNAAETSYMLAQQSAFEEATAWFYWTYKTEGKDMWNYKYVVEQEFASI